MYNKKGGHRLGETKNFLNAYHWSNESPKRPNGSKLRKIGPKTVWGPKAKLKSSNYHNEHIGCVFHHEKVTLNVQIRHHLPEIRQRVVVWVQVDVCEIPLGIRLGETGIVST